MPIHPPPTPPLDNNSQQAQEFHAMRLKQYTTLRITSLRIDPLDSSTINHKPKSINSGTPSEMLHMTQLNHFHSFQDNTHSEGTPRNAANYTSGTHPLF